MTGKTVVITGASSGIGKALAERFAKSGANVVLAARTMPALETVAASMDGSGKRVLCVSCDVTKEADCQQLIAAAVEKFGGIDVLVNNAGISMRAIFEDLHLEVIRRVMDINFWGTVYCTKAALPHLLKSRGSVVGVSSIAGKMGLPGRTGYSASKWAMEGFLSALRAENIKLGLHVLVACPGFTASNIRNTALTADGSSQSETPRDEKNMMSAETCAEHIFAATVARKRDLVLTGQGKLTVFLSKFFPSLLDKLAFKTMAKEPGSPLRQ
jgi:short-subunit dehydrogenase